MTAKTILEDDELSSPVSSEQPGTRPAIGKALAATARHRVLLGSVGIAVVAVVAVLAWRWTIRGESAPVAPSAGLNATSGRGRPLEITVLSEHVVAAAPAPPRPTVAAEPPRPTVAVPVSATAPARASRPIATVSSPSRPVVAPRSAPARVQSSSTAKSSPRPVAAAKSAPAEQPRAESAPARPQPKPDGLPLESNPYVYK